MDDRRAVAEDVRESVRLLWRRLTLGRTMSVGKLGVLAYLSKHGPTTASTLATAEGISPQAIATAVRELHDLGLVERTPDLADRRRVWIAISETGTTTLTQERSRGLDWLDDAIETRLTADEQQVLASTIPIFRKLIDDAPAERPPE